MSTERLYFLSETTAVEPLVNKWVAWAHVLAPVTGSLHLQHYQLELLQSYLKDPQVHARTCQDPKLRSGPFVDIPAERAGEVKALLSSTVAKLSGNLKLAKSLMEFQNYLVKEAKGQSLEPYYEKLPPSLRGYVELVYDYYHRPALRFFENMIYESSYYNSKLQSLRIFRQERDNSRAYIMNTPRLKQSGQVDWAVPFASPQVDEFFRLDSVPQPLGYIREILGLEETDDELLLPLLSETPPPDYEEWKEPGVRLRYFGHACVLIEWRGKTILTDPYIGVVPASGGIDRFGYRDLPEKIDYVLITHNHHDHFCPETLLRLRHRIGCLVVPRCSGNYYGDPSLKLLARRIGFANVLELEPLESIPLPDGEIVAVPFMGEHADLPHSKSAYVVRAGQERILFAADSDCLDQRMYEHLYRMLGPIETVFLGMECVGAPLSWSCGPFFPAKPDPAQEQSRRYKGCDAARGWGILEAVGARRFYNYAMGREPWLESLLGLALTEDSLQLRESAQLLARTRGEGFEAAELLYGKGEIVLASQAPAQASGSPAWQVESAPAPQAVFKDQFEFE